MGFCAKCGDIIKGGAGARCPCGGNAGSTLTDMNDGKDNRGDSHSNAYLSSGLSQGVEKGLRKMVGMADVSSECDCEGCGQKLRGNGDIFPGRDDNKPYCESCYGHRFKIGDCEKCHKPVLGLGKQYVREGPKKIWHRECYDGHGCSSCGETIMGQGVDVDGQKWHPQCFSCYECRINLASEGSFFPVDGYIMCKDCAPKHRTVTVTKQLGAAGRGGSGSGSGNGGNGGGSGASNRELNNAAAQDRQRELDALRNSVDTFSVSEKCGKCHEVMYGNGVKAPSGAIFHDDCFLCSGCGKDFPDRRFMEKDGKIWHSDCFKKANAVGCGICHQPISGSMLEYHGSKIHSACFKCSDCNKSLAGQAFAEVNNKPCCSGCATKNTKIETGKKGGFTVNQVTGNKEQREYGGMRFGGTVTMDPGAGPACGRCKKPVYVAERVLGPSGAHWHKACLTCHDCATPIAQSTLTEVRGEAYCNLCAVKKSGTKPVF
ncbi:hypothetical protein CAOG_04622 [Capsaspora owczarzaki ATCC 30864]|uniref:LIM zinc-binding domain-containing protein n=1 Tax=Capsaspora owczarzaki (strain ATCC 30864) TaxID=595528 RepID=A0A0D2X392_CAPO3|nr:hypothetical protein CAOG_04622 [Capsaspora owczarzaki ATCC 30864]KJE93904.1 hypothetical protein CAOG_004622 [Capsaspora owczarzaki ATCC 30864]|eukprot:XP_004347369.1 hypothetical protein CAOG_04622 [Capsaspora owczarzaki ATCC 30864]